MDESQKLSVFHLLLNLKNYMWWWKLFSIQPDCIIVIQVLHNICDNSYYLYIVITAYVMK